MGGLEALILIVINLRTKFAIAMIFLVNKGFG